MVRLVVPGEHPGEEVSACDAVEGVRDACEVLRRRLQADAGVMHPVQARAWAFDAMHEGAGVLEDLLRQQGRAALADDLERTMAEIFSDLGPDPRME